MASMSRTIMRNMERQALRRDFNANRVRCSKCGKQLYRASVFTRKVICKNCGWRGKLK